MTNAHEGCQTCIDELIASGIQADKNRIAALEAENESLRAQLEALQNQKPIAYCWDYFGRHFTDDPEMLRTLKAEKAPYFPLYAAPIPAKEPFNGGDTGLKIDQNTTFIDFCKQSIELLVKEKESNRFAFKMQFSFSAGDEKLDAQLGVVVSIEEPEHIDSKARRL